MRLTQSGSNLIFATPIALPSCTPVVRPSVNSPFHLQTDSLGRQPFDPALKTNVEDTLMTRPTHLGTLALVATTSAAFAQQGGPPRPSTFYRRRNDSRFTYSGPIARCPFSGTQYLLCE
jgi:hypothetical protein